MNYKLAVFGDSYADNKGPHPNEGWHQSLCRLNNWNINETLNTGQSGAGNWWAYANLIKMLQKHTAENIVVSFTSLGRFPMIKNPNMSFWFEKIYPNYNSSDLFYNILKNSTESNTIEILNFFKTSASIFYIEEENQEDYPNIVEYLNLNVWRSINELFERIKINAVFLIPFMDTYKKYTQFYQSKYKIITNIDGTSIAEMQRNKPGWDYIKWNDPTGNGHFSNDTRTNHLTNHNNNILAKEIKKGLEEDTGTHNFLKNKELDLSDGCLKKYGKIIWK